MINSYAITNLNNSISDVKRIVLSENFLELVRESKIYGKDIYRNFKWLQEFVESKGKYFNYNDYFSTNANSVLIDNGMIDIVKHLNNIGVETFSSCCGHMRFKSCVAIKGFYELPKHEGVEIRYLIISKSTVIYYGGATNSSRVYLSNLLKFTNYICELTSDDFKRLEINEVEFDDNLITQFAKYVLGLTNDKPATLSDDAIRLYSKDLMENYPHRIIKERLKEFRTTKRMGMFGE